MKNKGQIAPSTIVGIIIAVVVLVAIILFFTGRFQAGAQQFSDLSPQDIEIALTSCQFACDTASSGVNVPADCGRWEQSYCTRQVVVGGQGIVCETGLPPGETSGDKAFTFTCNPPFRNLPDTTPVEENCDCSD